MKYSFSPPTGLHAVPSLGMEGGTNRWHRPMRSRSCCGQGGGGGKQLMQQEGRKEPSVPVDAAGGQNEGTPVAVPQLAWLRPSCCHPAVLHGDGDRREGIRHPDLASHRAAGGTLLCLSFPTALRAACSALLLLMCHRDSDAENTSGPGLQPPCPPPPPPEGPLCSPTVSEQRC